MPVRYAGDSSSRDVVTRVILQESGHHKRTGTGIGTGAGTLSVPLAWRCKFCSL